MRGIVATGLAGALAAACLATTAGVAPAAPAAALSAHAAWCQQNYRSYDPASDTFTGNDGALHTCFSPDQAATTRTFGLGVAASGPTPPRALAAGGGYNVFPDESDPNYGTPDEPDTPQSGDE